MRLPGAGRYAVIADDEPDIATLLSLTLEARSYFVHLASDGEEALDLILRTLPDVVILDRTMPRMDGLDVIRALRAHPQTRSIPTVLLTAKAGDGDVWAGWQAGADQYLTKPIDFDILHGFLGALETGHARRSTIA